MVTCDPGLWLEREVRKCMHVLKVTTRGQSYSSILQLILLTSSTMVHLRRILRWSHSMTSYSTLIARNSKWLSSLHMAYYLWCLYRPHVKWSCVRVGLSLTSVSHSLPNHCFFVAMIQQGLERMHSWSLYTIGCIQHHRTEPKNVWPHAVVINSAISTKQWAVNITTG